MLSCADVVRVFVTCRERERRAAKEASGGRSEILRQSAKIANSHAVLAFCALLMYL